jgi:hypothetical protein
VPGFEFQDPGSGFRVSSEWLARTLQVHLVTTLGFRVPGSGLRFPGSGVRIPDFELRVSGLESQVSGFRFQVSGVWFRVSGHKRGVAPHEDGHPTQRGTTQKMYFCPKIEQTNNIIWP